MVKEVGISCEVDAKLSIKASGIANIIIAVTINYILAQTRQQILVEQKKLQRQCETLCNLTLVNDTAQWLVKFAPYPPKLAVTTDANSWLRWNHPHDWSFHWSGTLSWSSETAMVWLVADTATWAIGPVRGVFAEPGGSQFGPDINLFSRETFHAEFLLSLHSAFLMNCGIHFLTWISRILIVSFCLICLCSLTMAQVNAQCNSIKHIEKCMEMEKLNWQNCKMLSKSQTLALMSFSYQAFIGGDHSLQDFGIIHLVHLIVVVLAVVCQWWFS